MLLYTAAKNIRSFLPTHKVRCYEKFSSTFATPSSSVIFSGIQPTGVPHIGNYLGALRQWVRLQEASQPSTRLLFSVVDLHALTVRQDETQLRKWKTDTLATLLAIGLDAKRCTIFFQSDVPAHTQLMWILSCTASTGYLSRMTQWKSKLSLSSNTEFSDPGVKATLKLGLFSYPVLQAADILVHGTHVPVGDDQTQHIEFARECAQNFNSIHGPVLIAPKLLSSPAKRVMSLREPHRKMSKSHEDPRSRILLTDHPDDIRAKVRAAVTDSHDGFSHDPVHRPGVSNLLDLLSHFDREERSPDTIVEEFRGTSMRALKEAVAEAIIAHLAPIREKFNTLTNEYDQQNSLRDIAGRGAVEARSSSAAVLDRVHASIGI